MKPTKILLTFLLLVAFTPALQAQERPFDKERMQAIRDSISEVYKLRAAEQRIKSREHAMKRWEKLKANTRKDTIKVLDLSWLVVDKLPQEVVEFRNIKTLDINIWIMETTRICSAL